MVRGTERPKSALCKPGALPLVVAGEVDVLPAERGEVLEQLRIEGLPVSSGDLDRPLYVHGVPERDCGRDESQPACAIASLLEAPIPDFAETAEENGSGERVSHFTFVEAGMKGGAIPHSGAMKG